MGDAAAVAGLAAAVLGRWAERAEVYAERIALAPAGCWILEQRDGAIVGHCISHPWRRRAPPALDMPIGSLPDAADCWYVHDVAIAPAARGGGAVAQLLPRIARTATTAGIDVLALVAVGGAEAYWSRLGFARVEDAEAGFGADAVYMELSTRSL